MILNQENKTVSTNVVNKSKEFTIKTTAKAFKILSSGLYSDRVKAIIRELSCNAWDAHRAAHNTKPFDVHLPNSLEPWFSVRDYGTGLSEEDVMNLYSTYFESTKTDSNNQIGALGLGSKSPFSYTDSFNVISVFNGTRKSYTAFIDEHGTPSIVKIHEEECKEHNGLEVKFAVSNEDFNTFAHKAGVVFRVFKTAPNVIGNENFVRYKQTLTTVIEGRGWRYCTTDFYGRDGAAAVQGNIEYPIDSNQLGNLSEAQQSVLEGNFYIDFPIGDLDISASRESLGYDETTIENIKNALKRVYTSFSRKLNKEVKNTPTMWDAYIKAKHVLNGIGVRYHQYKNFEFKWGNTSFRVGERFEYTFSKVTDKKDKDGKPIVKQLDTSLRITQMRRERGHVSNRVSNIGSWSAEPFKTVSIEIEPDTEEHLFLVYNDADEVSLRKTLKKARQVARSNRGKNIYLLSEMSQGFFEAMGNPGYTFTSDIELEVSTKTKDGKVKYPNNYFTIDHNSYSKNFSFDQIKEHGNNKTEGHYYLSRVRDKILEGDKEVSARNCAALFKFLKNEGIIDSDAKLFSVKNVEQNTKRFKELGWTMFYDWAIERFTEWLDKHVDEYRDFIVLKRKENYIKNHLDWSLQEKIREEDAGSYTENSPFRRLIESFENIKNESQAHKDKLLQISNILNLATDLHIEVKKIDFDISEIDYKKNYPMLKILSGWEMRNNWTEVKAYINLVDNSK